MNIFSEILLWILGTAIFWLCLLLILRVATHGSFNSATIATEPAKAANRLTCEIVSDTNRQSSPKAMEAQPEYVTLQAKKRSIYNKANKVEDLFLMVVARRRQYRKEGGMK